MSNKVIISSVVATTALLAGLAAYTGSAMTTAIEDQLNAQNTVDGINATIIKSNDGLFSRNQTYKIVLTAEYLRQQAEINTISDDITLYLDHHYTAYPLYTISDFQLDFSRGSLPAELNKIGLSTVEHRITLNSNLLLQTNQLNLSLAPLNHKLNNTEVSYQGVSLIANSDFDLNKGSIVTEIGKFEVASENRRHLSLSKLVTQTKFETIDKLTLFTSIKAAVNNISFSDSVEQLSLEIDQFSSDSSYSMASAEKLSLTVGTDVAKITYQDRSTHYSIVDSQLAVRINNIAKKAYLAAEHASRQSQPAPKAVSTAFMALIAAGADGEITRLNLNINDVNFNSQGDFVLPPYTGKKMPNELNQHVLNTLIVNLTLNLSNGYPQLLGPLAPMFDHLIKQGYIAKDPQGNVSSTIHYTNTQLTANNQPVAM